MEHFKDGNIYNIHAYPPEQQKVFALILGALEFLPWIGALAVLLLVLRLVFGWGMDSTDNHATGERSNMRLLKDHGTGIEYLEGPGGGLIQRAR